MTDDLVKRLADEEKTQRALAACDELAEAWAVEVDISDMAIAIASKPDVDSRIVALAKQSFIEGTYRAVIQYTDAIDRLTAERDAAQVALNRLYDACELRANKEGGDYGPEIGPAIYHIDEIRALSPSTLNKPE